MQGGNIIHIKGMVCERCISIVKSQMESLGLYPEEIDLGRVMFSGTGSLDDKRMLNDCLSAFGLSVLEDKTETLLQNTLNLIKEVYSGEFPFPDSFRFSDYAKRKLSKEYDIISRQFSMHMKITIEKFIISYRIERAKCLITSQQFHLSEIAFKLGFASMAHLSRQFKSETGITASGYKALVSS